MSRLGLRLVGGLAHSAAASLVIAAALHPPGVQSVASTDALDPMQRRMLAHLVERAVDDAPLPEICFAPGTPAHVLEAFYAAATGSSTQLESFRLSTRWSTTASSGGGLQQGDPTTITWGIVPDGTSIAGFAGEPSAPSDLVARFNAIYGSQAAWQALIQQVFDRWGSLTGARYVFEPNDDGAPLATASGSLGTRADVRIGGHFIDGNSGVLAYNFFPNNGDMVLDSSDSFFSNTSGNSLRLRNVVSHEHGHGLGISHVCPVNQSKLMEPFATTAFDGPQHDDILTGNRGYGDPNEHNDSAAAATSLGTLANGTITVGGVSIDDNGDVDYYRFSVGDTSRQISVTLQPQGTTYLEGQQFSNGSCSAGSSFNSLSLNDVGVELIGTNGSTVLATANSNGAGSLETLGPFALSSATGPYYVRVFGGSNDTAQLYQVFATISDVGAPPAPGPVPPPAPGPVPPPAPISRTLTVTKIGTGAGTVTSSPAGIDCGSTCAANFPEGTIVSLAAAAAPGSTFRGFSGSPDCTDGSVTLSADVTCIATFGPAGGVVDRLTGPLILNGDARGDGIRYNVATGAWTMMMENGLAGAVAPVLAPTASGVTTPGWTTIKTGDFNADGLSDLFLYMPASGQWVKAVNRGPEGFPLFVGSWTPPTWSVAIHDVSGDGRADVFLYDPNTGAWVNGVSVGDGTEGFEYRQGTWIANWQVHPVTFNGDGFGDFFLHDPVTGQWAGALNAGGDYTLYAGSWDPGWEVVPADLNGDGIDDFFLYARATGRWQVATISGTGFSFTSGTAPPGRTVRPGDFDGDGRMDLFLYDPLTGNWEQRVSNGAGGFLVTAGAFAAGWTVFPTRFDDDPRTDLLLYNAASGAYAQALNTGPGTFTLFSGVWAPNETIVATQP